MMHQTLYLSFTMPDGEAKTIELKPQAGAAIQIGRNRASQIKLNLPSLSRAHARFFYESGVFWVEDLGSSNGTFVNKEQIHHVRISPGDLIQCGEFELQVLSHSSTSVYQSAPQADDAEEVIEVEVIDDEGSLLPSQGASLEPRPRPPMPKLSAPPRAHPASLPTFNHTAINGAPHSAPGALHSKAPTDRPLEHRPTTGVSLPPRSPSVSPSWQSSAQEEASARELAQLKEEREALKLSLSELQEQLTNLNAQAEAERMIYEQNKGALKSLEQAKSSLQEELKSAQEELKSAQEELKSAQGDQREASDEQQQQLEAALTEVSELRETLEETRRELKLSREREDSSASSEATNAQERQALQEQLSQRAQDIDELTQARALAQEALNQTRGELQREREQWQQERAALQAELAALKERTSEVTLASQTTHEQRFTLPAPNHNATSPDWAAHQARFEQLSQTLALLKDISVKAGLVSTSDAHASREASPQAQEPSQEQPSQAQQLPQQQLSQQQLPAAAPQDQKPREWRGLV